MNSLAFCLAELGDVYSKLLKEVNSGDDSGVPTVRHNEAWVTCQHLPELQEELQDNGHRLSKYLATRLVYHEFKQEIFERLYFTETSTVSPLTTSTSCLTLEAILTRRQDGLLSLVEQTPAP